MGKLIQSPCYLPIIAATALLWSFSAKADEPNLAAQSAEHQTAGSTSQGANASHRTSTNKSANSTDDTDQSSTASGAVETPAQLGSIPCGIEGKIFGIQLQYITLGRGLQISRDFPESADDN